MSFDWNAESEKADVKGGSAEKIPEGYSRVRLGKVITGKKDAPGFINADGDPQIMAIYKDSEDREASQMYTLSGSNRKWFLAALKHLGADMQALSDSGLTPESFTDRGTATRHLVGLEGWALVEHKVNGKYANVYIVGVDEVPAETLQKAKAAKPATVPEIPSEDDIPF